MSKKAKRSATFTYQLPAALPKTPNIKTEWGLKSHYYSSATDPQIERDAVTYEKAIRSFCRKYRNSDFTATSTKLKKALTDYERLLDVFFAAKVIRYFSFRTTLNVNDTEAAKKLAQYSERFKKIGNELLFFSLTLGQISKTKQKEYLKDLSLQHFRYYLQQTFEAAKHQLTESEEKILHLTQSTSSGMWEDATEKILGNRKITFKKTTYTIPEALENIDVQSWENKNKLWNLILDQLVEIGEFAEHELSAVVNYDKLSDDLRGYKKPYSATVLAYENNERSIETLVEAISTKGFNLSQKFYAIKADIHGSKIPYVNKYDPIGTFAQPDFATSVTICRDTFYSVKKEYGEFFDQMLENGQIDVYPKAGKRGGAFMSNTHGLPTYVMLNHTNTFKSLETLAHEVGHAIHAQRSKVQSPLYSDFSTTTAETASTLFEQLVQQRLFAQLTPQDQYVFLHDKISRDIATIQRQIACFNFELDMHEHIRQEGLATKEELAKLMTKHLRAYLGPAVETTDRDGYSFVYWSHIRYGFYVYTYTYGILMSNLMARRYEADNSYATQIDTFLSAGSTDTVENIFKSIGIRADKLSTFEESLDTLAEDIALFQKLRKRFS